MPSRRQTAFSSSAPSDVADDQAGVEGEPQRRDRSRPRSDEADGEGGGADLEGRGGEVVQRLARWLALAGDQRGQRQHARRQVAERVQEQGAECRAAGARG